uniref:Uncharacterized protein n=1 Tax=Lepeophtheirus salmonis TaxID=72036 RepID=A0A0K2UDP1_LEPSM
MENGSLHYEGSPSTLRRFANRESYLRSSYNFACQGIELYHLEKCESERIQWSKVRSILTHHIQFKNQLFTYS